MSTATPMGFTPSLSAALILLAALVAIIIPLFSRLYASPATADSTLYCVASPAVLTIHTNSLKPSVANPACFRVSTTTGRFTEVLAQFPTTGAAMKDIVYLPGHVLPGLIDGHGHVLQYGEMLESVALYGARSMDDVRGRIKDFLKKAKGKAAGDGIGSRKRWIRGVGWDQGLFGGVMPTADELSLDPELADLYIMLDRVDVHCVLVSQKVLDLLPNPLPPSPPGGEVITSPGPGVFCDNAMDKLIFPLAPKADLKTKKRWFRAAFKSLNSLGITGVGDAGMRAGDVAILEDIIKSQSSNSSSDSNEKPTGLPVRLSVMLECAQRNTFCPDEIAHLTLLSHAQGTPTPSLLLGGAKIFADGALGSWGAAMISPYSDRPTAHGSMLLPAPALSAVVKAWWDAGFQVNVHAIGDLANRAAIDAFEAVLGADCAGCNDAHRLRIEHAQIIDPADQARIRRLGIIPSIQPTHATSDMAYAAARLGKDRLARSAYRMRSLFPEEDGNGYPGPVLGSDFPVEPPSPFAGMYAAVTRRSPNAPPGSGKGWYMDEALSVEQALAGFTRNAAYGWFREADVGAIEVGMWADWVVVDRDIFTDRTGEGLRDVEVRETWVGGRRVFNAAEEEQNERSGHDEL